MTTRRRPAAPTKGAAPARTTARVRAADGTPLCTRCAPGNRLPARLYPDGWCCAEHSPAARRRLVEQQEGKTTP